MSVYDITITAAGLNSSAPADGFIDNKTVYSYMDTDNTAPSSLANAKAKMRANRRYTMLILQLTRMMSSMRVTQVTKTGGGANAPASVITIRIETDRDDALVTADESNAGQFLNGTAALRRCAARALVVTESRNSEIFDPTVVVGRDIDGTDNPGIRRGTVFAVEDIGSLAANLTAAQAAIAVVKIS